MEHELLVLEFPPRPDREPEPNLFIDTKFNYWNLPVKAKVLLVSNVPKVRIKESIGTAKINNSTGIVSYNLW
jgi:hypothetical protein